MQRLKGLKPRKPDVRLGLQAKAVELLNDRCAPRQILMRLKSDFPDDQTIRISYEQIY